MAIVGAYHRSLPLTASLRVLQCNAYFFRVHAENPSGGRALDNAMPQMKPMLKAKGMQTYLRITPQRKMVLSQRQYLAICILGAGSIVFLQPEHFECLVSRAGLG